MTDSFKTLTALKCNNTAYQKSANGILIPRVFFPHKIVMMPTGQRMACFAAHPFSCFDSAFGETVCPDEIVQ